MLRRRVVLVAGVALVVVAVASGAAVDRSRGDGVGGVAAHAADAQSRASDNTALVETTESRRAARRLYHRKETGGARFRQLQALNGRRFPGGGLLKKVGSLAKKAVSAAASVAGAVAGAAAAAILTRSTSLVMTPSRKCVMCEFVVQMADTRLRENPYSDWEGLPDMRPFVSEFERMAKPPAVKAGSGPGKPPNVPPPPAEPGSGSATDFGSSGLLAPVTPSTTSRPAEGGSGGALLEVAEAESLAALHQHTVAWMLQPPDAAAVPLASAPAFNPFPRSPAMLQTGEGYVPVPDFATPAGGYVDTPMADGAAMHRAAPGVYPGARPDAFDGRAGYEFGGDGAAGAPPAADSHAAAQAAAAMRFRSARRGLEDVPDMAAAAGMMGAMGGGGTMPSAYRGTPVDAAAPPTSPDAEELLRPAGGNVGGGPSAYHGRPAPEVLDILAESREDAAAAVASAHKLPSMASTAIRSVARFRSGLLQQVDADLGATTGTGAGTTASLPSGAKHHGAKSLRRLPGGSGARFASTHAAQGATATATATAGGVFGAVTKARAYKNAAKSDLLARVTNLNAGAAVLPHMASRTPALKGKVGAHEEVRDQYRMVYQVRLQKLFREFMGAMDDVCRTVVPQDQQQACRPMFAKAEEIVDMMLHGYASDGICQRLRQCSLTFFN